MTLQPCPFCGKQPKTLREHSGGVACPNADCPNHGKFWTGDLWNRLALKPVAEVKL